MSRYCMYCGEKLPEFFNLDIPYCAFGCDGKKLQKILDTCSRKNKMQLDCDKKERKNKYGRNISTK